MKKSNILLGLLLVPFAAAALDVPTDPEPRVVLLEEFTGINCGNCPDGHRVAARLMAAQPGLFIPVCVHAGHYARPASDQPDFRTAYGEALNGRFDVNSYPSGVINRQSVGQTDGYMLSRSAWPSAAHDVSAELSAVNVRCAATYGGSDRVLDIEVAGVLTADVADLPLAVSVVMLESGIQGPQAGGRVGDEYVHRHMLRDCIVDARAVAAKAKGEAFAIDERYTLPADFNSVECRPERVELVAFVTDATGRVVTAAKCYPSLPDAPDAVAASVAPGKIAVGSAYGFPFLNVLVTSEMVAPIRSLTFETRFNDEAPRSVTVECDIPREEAREVAVDFAPAELLAEGNSVSVSLTAINGKPFAAPAVSAAFAAPASVPADLVLKIKTDDHASDNRYRLLDASGATVSEFGPWPDGDPVASEHTLTLDPGKTYCLEVTDAWSDGILDPRGYVKLYDTEGNIVAQNLDIKEFGWRHFFFTGGNSGIGTVTADAIGIDRATGIVSGADGTPALIYAADGTLVGTDGRLDRLAPGLYIATVRRIDGSVATAKFIR